MPNGAPSSPVEVSAVASKPFGLALGQLSTPMAIGVRPTAMAALGFCRTCGRELAAGESHDESCAEDAFVFDDPEYARLLGSECDARDDYEAIRRSPRVKRVAIARAKLEAREKATAAREAALREQFRREHE